MFENLSSDTRNDLGITGGLCRSRRSGLCRGRRAEEHRRELFLKAHGLEFQLFGGIFGNDGREGCGLFSDESGAAGGFEEVGGGGASGAPRRLAREDASEEEVRAAGITGTSGFFATGKAAF